MRIFGTSVDQNLWVKDGAESVGPIGAVRHCISQFLRIFRVKFM